MRTRVYRSIVELLSDRDWHKLAEIAKVTSYPEAWLRELARDPLFEIDSDRDRIRLRGLEARGATT